MAKSSLNERRKGQRMVNIEKLKDKITETGLKLPLIATRAGMDRYTLYNRLKGKGEFTASEIVGISKALKLTKAERNDIFLS